MPRLGKYKSTPLKHMQFGNMAVNQHQNKTIMNVFTNFMKSTGLLNVTKLKLKMMNTINMERNQNELDKMVSFVLKL